MTQSESSSRFLFISHSSKDAALVNIFEKFISKIKAPNYETFCSSQNNHRAKSGEPFPSQIKENIKNSEMVFFIYSNNFRKSLMCNYEMGAVWELNVPHMIIFIPPCDQNDLPVIFPKEQSYLIGKIEDLEEIVNQLNKKNLLSHSVKMNRIIKNYYIQMSNFIPQSWNNYIENCKREISENNLTILKEPFKKIKPNIAKQMRRKGIQNEIPSDVATHGENYLIDNEIHIAKAYNSRSNYLITSLEKIDCYYTKIDRDIKIVVDDSKVTILTSTLKEFIAKGKIINTHQKMFFTEDDCKSFHIDMVSLNGKEFKHKMGGIAKMQLGCKPSKSNPRLFTTNAVKVITKYPYNRLIINDGYTTKLNRFYHTYPLSSFCKELQVHCVLIDKRSEKDNELLLLFESFFYSKYSKTTTNALIDTDKELRYLLKDLIPGDGYSLTICSI